MRHRPRRTRRRFARCAVLDSAKGKREARSHAFANAPTWEHVWRT
jgi:hypothetical protein